jgi:hypothetical protein
VGRNEHDTKKHGPGTARPGSIRARAWPGPTPCQCLGRIVRPWAGTRHGTEKGQARRRHGLERRQPLDPRVRRPQRFQPLILGWVGGKYIRGDAGRFPPTSNPKSFSPSPRRPPRSPLRLAMAPGGSGSNGRRRLAAVSTSSSRPPATSLRFDYTSSSSSRSTDSHLVLMFFFFFLQIC